MMAPGLARLLWQVSTAIDWLKAAQPAQGRVGAQRYTWLSLANRVGQLFKRVGRRNERFLGDIADELENLLRTVEPGTFKLPLVRRSYLGS